VDVFVMADLSRLLVPLNRLRSLRLHQSTKTPIHVLKCVPRLFLYDCGTQTTWLKDLDTQTTQVYIIQSVLSGHTLFDIRSRFHVKSTTSTIVTAAVQQMDLPSGQVQVLNPERLCRVFVRQVDDNQVDGYAQASAGFVSLELSCNRNYIIHGFAAQEMHLYNAESVSHLAMLMPKLQVYGNPNLKRLHLRNLHLNELHNPSITTLCLTDCLLTRAMDTYTNLEHLTFKMCQMPRGVTYAISHMPNLLTLLITLKNGPSFQERARIKCSITHNPKLHYVMTCNTSPIHTISLNPNLLRVYCRKVVPTTGHCIADCDVEIKHI
jgi:hypothetical protein